MPIYRGSNTNREAFYRGNVKSYGRIYVGDRLVWQKQSEDHDSFIFEINVSANESFTIPTYNMSGYNYSINWGNGSPLAYCTTWDDVNSTYSYAEAGTYLIQIKGSFPRIYTAGHHNLAYKITRVLQWGNVGFQSFNHGFYGCGNLQSLPDGPITGAEDVTDFSDCFFYNTELASIPAGLFDYTPNVLDFSGCFQHDDKITSIPAGLFDYTPNVTNFWACFANTSNLTSIPAGLFDYTPNVTHFKACFRFTPNLTSIPAGLFNNNPNVTDFSYCFYDCTSLSGTTPSALWSRNPAPNGYGCFYNCTGLSDYLSIPFMWKVA